MNGPPEPSAEAKSLAQAFFIWMGLEAAVYLAGIAVCGVAVKAGVSVALEPGFDHRAAGIAAVGAGAFGIYKIVRDAAEEVGALRRISETDILRRIDEGHDELDKNTAIINRQTEALRNSSLRKPSA
jgi:hypothetical protein